MKSIFYTINLIVFIVYNTSSCFAQAPATVLESYQKGDYAQVINTLTNENNAKNNGKKWWHHYLGLSYFHTNNANQSKIHLKKYLKKPFWFWENWLSESRHNAYWCLAKSYHLNHQFDSAAYYYKKYLEVIPSANTTLRQTPKICLQQCEWGGRWIELASETPLAAATPLGKEVNTSGDESFLYLHPLPPHSLHFSANNQQKQYNIFSASLGMGTWSSSDAGMSFFNTTQTNDIIAGFYGSKNQLLLQREQQLLAANPDATTTEDKFMPFAPEIIINAIENRDFYWYSDSLVIFSSNRSGGYGGLDLYYARLQQDGTWGIIHNLGAAVNSPFDEVAPFLEKDGHTLFFSSQRPYGFGGFDFYQSSFSDTTLLWSAPQMLLPPLSSTGDDLYWRSYPDGRQVYFCSNRQGGQGGLDIYSAYWLSPQQYSARSNNFADYLMGKVKIELPQIVSTEPKVKIIKIDTFTISTVFYPRSEGNWIGDRALITQLTNVLTKNPETMAVLTAHTDNSGINDYDAFLAVQRAEILCKKLIDNDVRPDQLLIRGCGQSYPIARNNSPGGAPDINGRKMNQRIETRVLTMPQTPASIEYELPTVSEILVDTLGVYYRNTALQLFYKVQIAESSTFLTHPIFKNSKHLSVEKYAQQDKSRYFIGFEPTFAAAQSLLQNSRQQGFTDARIVAYFNGFPLLPEQIQELTIHYPDLQKYWEYIKE